MRIVLCEPDKVMRGLLSSYIHDALVSKGYYSDLYQFESCDTYLQTYGQTSAPDVLFLQGSESGIKAARVVRDNGYRGFIVFVSEFLEYAPKAYEVGAYRYIIKDDEFRANTRRCVLNICDEILFENQSFEYSVNGVVYSVPLESILYIESNLRKERIVSTIELEEAEFYMRTIDLESKLHDSGFIRINKGILVNAIHCVAFEEHKVLLDNDDYLPISARRFSESKASITAWNAHHRVLNR